MSKAKIPIAISDLERHMIEQIGFLRRSIRDYDAGELSEFKRLAATIRTLVHDTPQSHSLMGQLDLKGDFLSYSYMPDRRNLLTQFCVGMFVMTESGMSYQPLLTAYEPRVLPFAQWWDEVVIIDDQKNEISRKQLVLAVANKDGGAHVDRALDGVYHALSRMNSLGWIAVSNGMASDMEHAEKVALRHIAFEVVDVVERGFLTGLGKCGCYCGSGRAARYCHLRDEMKKIGSAAKISDKFPPWCLHPAP